jgi:hypothetical protein
MRSASGTQRALLARSLSACGMTHGATRRCLAAQVFTVGDELLLLLLRGVARTGSGRVLAAGLTCRPLVTRGHPERTLAHTKQKSNMQSRTTKNGPAGGRAHVISCWGGQPAMSPPKGVMVGGCPALPYPRGRGSKQGRQAIGPSPWGTARGWPHPPCCFAAGPWDAEAVPRGATHGSPPVGHTRPAGRASDGGGSPGGPHLLAFRVLAAHVSTMVEGLLLLLRGVVKTWPGRALALVWTCGQQSRRDNLGGHM